MKLSLRIWRQKDRNAPGRFVTYPVETTTASVDWDVLAGAEHVMSTVLVCPWVMGGSFRHPCDLDQTLPCTAVAIGNDYEYLGFRCALDVPGGKP